MRRSRRNWNRMGRWFVGATFLAAFALSVLMLSGCGDIGPTRPADEQGTGNSLKALGVVDSLLNQGASGLAAGSGLDYLKESSYFVADAAASLVVGEQGGTLKLQLENEEVYFEVPAGALSQTVEITIWGFKFRTPFGDAFLYDCSPDGLQFALPIQVTHEFGLNQGVWSVLAYFDDVTGEMSIEQVSRVINGKAKFQINHFSKYGIS